jgi:glycosyltransferase involved in cell wall biosynthesis
LQSIAIQTFTDYEIVITDDSPDESVMNVVDIFSSLPVSYFKNPKALGTPANWNYAISMAKGEWIKLMHDDDWFRSKDSLQKFADKTSENRRFIFSGFATVFASGNEKQSKFPLQWERRILNHPVSLIAQNVIGTPSVTLIHTSVNEAYDERMKWRVDIDYYIRLLMTEKNFVLIDEPLVNVGMSEGQVTNYSINVPEVELPEGLLLLEKYGVNPLRQLLIYDAWWRILRNTRTHRKEQLYQFAPKNSWPEVIIKMVAHQSIIPGKLLKWGVVSKASMFFSYLLNKKYLHN